MYCCPSSLTLSYVHIYLVILTMSFNIEHVLLPCIFFDNVIPHRAYLKIDFSSYKIWFFFYIFWLSWTKMKEITPEKFLKNLLSVDNWHAVSSFSLLFKLLPPWHSLSVLENSGRFHIWSWLEFRLSLTLLATAWRGW